MKIELHVSEINAAIALFSGMAEKFRDQAIAQSQTVDPEPIAAPAPAPERQDRPVVRKATKRR